MYDAGKEDYLRPSEHIGLDWIITNRKSYMGFRLVPKSVTLNDLERRNGPYFALFHGIR